MERRTVRQHVFSCLTSPTNILKLKFWQIVHILGSFPTAKSLEEKKVQLFFFNPNNVLLMQILHFG